VTAEVLLSVACKKQGVTAKVLLSVAVRKQGVTAEVLLQAFVICCDFLKTYFN